MEKPNNLGGAPSHALPKRILIFIFRFFFKLLYHQFAWTYDWVASIVSLGMWQKWVKSVVPYLKGPRVLEIGFGPGHLLIELYQNGLDAYGLDKSYQMGQIAHKRLAKLGLCSNLTRADAQTLPFADNSFNQVVLTFPAEYIFDPNTNSEILRVLINGGEAIILPIAWITGRKPLERLAAWVNRITGEAPAWNEMALDPMKNIYDQVSWEMINLENSKILVIHTQKSSTPE